MKMDEKQVNQHIKLMYMHLRDDFQTKPVTSAVTEFSGFLLSSSPDILTYIKDHVLLNFSITERHLLQTIDCIPFRTKIKD